MTGKWRRGEGRGERTGKGVGGKKDWTEIKKAEQEGMME